MKKIILSSILALSTTFGLRAQLTEGHTSYSIDIKADNPEMAMAVGMMQGSTLDIYVNKDMTRTESKMGTMMTTVTVMDIVKQNGVMLMSGMVGKLAIPLDLKKMNEESEAPKPEVTKTSETKEILGYTCTKTILTMEDGVELNYWLTDKIVGNLEGQQMHFDGIDGYPLEYQMNMQGMFMTVTATKVETSLTKEQKNTLFSTKVPEGYTEKTMDDLKKMFGGQ